MKKIMKDHRLAVFFVPYAVFTITCGCLGWMFPEYRVLMFQIWYQVSAVIWLALAVTALALFIRLQKLKKLKNEINHRKE